MLRRITRKVALFAFLASQEDMRIEERGHRDYVGGLWDEIGQLQFSFLLDKGLQPDSFLLDIACGSLRLGVKAIPYLRPSHYLGIEKESGLVKAGLERNSIPESEKKSSRV